MPWGIATRALGRGRRLLVIAAVGVTLGLGGPGGSLTLLFGVDAVGLALLERLAVLVEVGAEVVDHLGDRLAQLLLALVVELAVVVDRVHQLGLLRAETAAQVLEERCDAVGLDPVEVAAGAGVDRGDLLRDRKRVALGLV